MRDCFAVTKLHYVFVHGKERQDHYTLNVPIKKKKKINFPDYLLLAAETRGVASDF